MSKTAVVTDLSRIAKPPAEKSPSDKPEEVAEKELTPEEEEEIVYRKVAKRKRDKLEEGRRDEATAKADIIKKGIERRKKIIKIKNWCSGFKDILGDFIKDKQLEKLSDEELDALQEEIKFMVSSKTSGIITDQTASSLFDWIEDGLKEHTGLKVSGPKISLKQLAASKDCNDLVKELTLEYADIIYQRPEYRMLFFLVNGVYAIHKINEDALMAAPPAVVNKVGDKEPPPKRARTENDPAKDKDGYEVVA